MKTVKQFLFIASVVMAFALTACGGEEDSKKESKGEKVDPKIKEYADLQCKYFGLMDATMAEKDPEKKKEAEAKQSKVQQEFLDLRLKHEDEMGLEAFAKFREKSDDYREKHCNK
jgi:uncharacterized lipoprotein YehR (DUF1307 family)